MNTIQHLTYTLYTALTAPHNLRIISSRRERGAGCPERPEMDMLVRELKEELEARDQPKTGNKAWLRRRLVHGAIVRARILQSERHREWAPCTPYLEWTLLPFCEIGQTFTILIRV